MAVHNFEAENHDGNPMRLTVRPHYGRDGRIIISGMPNLSLSAEAAAQLAVVLLFMAREYTI